MTDDNQKLKDLEWKFKSANELNKTLQQQVDDLIKEKDSNVSDAFNGYRCGMCSQVVNFVNILPIIRSSGFCPSCYHIDYKRRKTNGTT